MTKTHVHVQVKCYGPGLEPTGCIVNKPAKFTIDACEAGRGHLQIYAQVYFSIRLNTNSVHETEKVVESCLRWFVVLQMQERMKRTAVIFFLHMFYFLFHFSMQDSEGFPIDIQITDNGDSTYFCVYIPTKPIKHTIIITWGEVNVSNSPFRVRA